MAASFNIPLLGFPRHRLQKKAIEFDSSEFLKFKLTSFPLGIKIIPRLNTGTSEYDELKISEEINAR